MLKADATVKSNGSICRIGTIVSISRNLMHNQVFPYIHFADTLYSRIQKSIESLSLSVIVMKRKIKIEVPCPQCHKPIEGDESLRGQKVS